MAGENFLNLYLYLLCKFSNPNLSVVPTNETSQGVRPKLKSSTDSVPWPTYDIVKQEYILLGKYRY